MKLMIRFLRIPNDLILMQTKPALNGLADLVTFQSLLIYILHSVEMQLQQVLQPFSNKESKW